jgi:predicted ATP-grasp superfamily ATP-dependent carboligase
MPGSSSACSARHVVPRPRGDATAFVAGVRAAVAAGGYDVVFGGGDDWMAALSTYRDRIPTRVAHPPVDVVEAALDKVTLAELAHEVGLAAPRTLVADDGTLDGWQGPVVVKCRTHWARGQTRPHRIDARLYADASAARPQVERIRRAGGQPVLQRPVDGRLGALVGLLHEGRLVGRVQQVATRLWPTPYGASARAVTVAVDEALAARSEDLLRRLGWSGLVELQFLTGADGVPHLTDLNGRFYGSLSLADAAQPALVDAWARQVLGEPVPEMPDASPGARYSWFAGDLRRAVVERRRGPATDLLGTVGWAVRAHHSVWDVRDPGPAWYLATERARRLRVPDEPAAEVVSAAGRTSVHATSSRA